MNTSSQTLKQIIQTHGWASVAAILRSLYPKEEKNIDGYEDLFSQLRIMAAEDIQMVIVLKTVIDGDEEYVDVSGKYKYPKTEEEKFSQAIEFLPWRQWLGMGIDPESLQEFTELEIIAHCLYEMTFISFEEEEIQKTLEDINKPVEYESLSQQENRENMLTFEEILKELKDFGGSTEEEE